MITTTISTSFLILSNESCPRIQIFVLMGISFFFYVSKDLKMSYFQASETFLAFKRDGWFSIWFPTNGRRKSKNLVFSANIIEYVYYSQSQMFTCNIKSVEQVSIADFSLVIQIPAFVFIQRNTVMLLYFAFYMC